MHRAFRSTSGTTSATRYRPIPPRPQSLLAGADYHVRGWWGDAKASDNAGIRGGWLAVRPQESTRRAHWRASPGPGRRAPGEHRSALTSPRSDSEFPPCLPSFAPASPPAFWPRPSLPPHWAIFVNGGSSRTAVAAGAWAAAQPGLSARRPSPRPACRSSAARRAGERGRRGRRPARARYRCCRGLASTRPRSTTRRPGAMTRLSPDRHRHGGDIDPADGKPHIRFAYAPGDGRSLGRTGRAVPISTWPCAWSPAAACCSSSSPIRPAGRELPARQRQLEIPVLPDVGRHPAGQRGGQQVEPGGDRRGLLPSAAWRLCLRGRLVQPGGRRWRRRRSAAGVPALDGAGLALLAGLIAVTGWLSTRRAA